MTTPGHVFVTSGDLRYLACDAWLVPTDERMVVEPRWHLAPETPWGSPVRPPEWSSTGVRALAVPGPAPDPRWQVWTNVGADHGEGVGWFVDGAQQFVRAAAAALDGAVPQRGRANHLIALPVVGSGLGGGRQRTGAIVRELLPALERLAAEHGLDICLVTWKERAHAAAQSIRRERWPRGFDLESAAPVRQQVERLASLASRGELVLFLGAGLGVGAGLPTWRHLLVQLATAAGFSESDQRRLDKLDLLDRARLVESRLRQSTESATRAALGSEVARILSSPWRSLSHTLLASLPVTEVATTNYDELFELASADAGRGTAILPYQPSREHPRWLLKLHGCVTRPEHIVLTRDDYLRFAESRAALAGIVQALLVTRHMLFVGFSLTDDNFHRIIHDVRQALPADTGEPRTFGTALMLDNNPLLGELWRSEIEVLPMAAEGPSDEPAAARQLEVFLDALGMLAADGTAHLLDASFDGALGEAERVLREQLTEFQRRLPDQVWSTAAGRRLARLLQEFGAPAPPIAGGRRVGQGRRSPEVAKTEALLDGPVELVVLSVKDSAVRCRPLDSQQPVTLRASGLWEVVPGEVIVVAPRKQWRYARHPYLSGEILSARLAVQVLGLVPLRLEDHGLWHPDEEYWGEDGDPIEEWARPIIARGARRTFEMEQVLPGADVDDPDSDPIIEANDAKDAGDRTTARRILMQLCEADVRCLDGHAHLGNLAFDSPDVALRHYEVGVRIGDLSLGVDFDGLLPWGGIDNRPFLRCLHGYGLSCWRLGRFEDAERIFDRMLWLNPSDNQGARMLIGPVKAKAAWEAREGW